MTHSTTSVSRRKFVGTSASLMSSSLMSASLVGGSALSTSSRPLLVTLGAAPEPIVSIQDPRVKALLQHALDAARSAGATYADMRLSYTKQRFFDTERPDVGDLPFERERLGAGIRALVDGYWGFASGPVWSRDEMARLGREAVRQAKVNSLSKPREFYWPATPVVQGHWETPVKIDAFTMHPVEIRERFDGLREEMRLMLARYGKFGIARGLDPRGAKQGFKGGVIATFTIQEKAFGSTEGSYVTQRLHWSKGSCGCDAENVGEYSALEGNAGWRTSTAGAGWEMFDRVSLLETIREQVEANLALPKLPTKPIEVGRYHAVFDAGSVASLLGKTIGVATEIDRMLGYEANGDGTSYLNDPDEMLGSFALGSEHLTVTANRSEPGGAATTKWDDEGVAPDDFTLIKNGVIHDTHTSREGAGWLKKPYAREGRPIRSHGCLFAESGQVVPMIHPVNLAMQPGQDSAGVRELEMQMGTGISVIGARPDVDFQLSSGLINNMGFAAWEVRGGKRVARFANPGVLFRTTELWKNLLALGGARTAERWGMEIEKGQPEQLGLHSVTAVPMLVRDVAFIDRRKR